MIVKAYYINSNVDKALRDTDLSMDELVSIVGRFRPHSRRAGSLRGEIIKLIDGTVIIRHHFTKKELWRQNG